MSDDNVTLRLGFSFWISAWRLKTLVSSSEMGSRLR